MTERERAVMTAQDIWNENWGACTEEEFLVAAASVIEKLLKGEKAERDCLLTTYEETHKESLKRQRDVLIRRAWDMAGDGRSRDFDEFREALER